MGENGREQANSCSISLYIFCAIIVNLLHGAEVAATGSCFIEMFGTEGAIVSVPRHKRAIQLVTTIISLEITE